MIRWLWKVLRWALIAFAFWWIEWEGVGAGPVPDPITR